MKQRTRKSVQAELREFQDEDTREEVAAYAAAHEIYMDLMEESEAIAEEQMRERLLIIEGISPATNLPLPSADHKRLIDQMDLSIEEVEIYEKGLKDRAAEYAVGIDMRDYYDSVRGQYAPYRS